MIYWLRSFVVLSLFVTCTNAAYACALHEKDQANNETEENSLNKPASVGNAADVASTGTKKEEKSEPKVDKLSKKAAAGYKSGDLDKKDQSKEAKTSKLDAAEKVKKNEAKLNVTDAPEAVQAATEIMSTEAKETLADLQVVDFVLTNQIEAREPKEVVECFTKENDRGFAFARISAKGTKEVTFLWIRNGSEYARQTMPVHAAKKWRTYSSVKLKSGEWKVQLMSDNNVLAEKAFTVE